MKVALYYPWLYVKSGAERVIVKLLEESRHDWTVFTGRYEAESTYPELRSAKIVDFGDLVVERTVWATAFNCLKALWRRLPLEGFDALVVVGEGLGDLVLIRNGSLPTINICLTPLRIAFDEVYQEQYLSKQGFFKGLVVRAGSCVFRAFDRIAWRRFDHTFFISEEVRRRAVKGELPGASQGEILHVGLGVTPARPGERYDRFFLLPGRMMWTKNIELGIRAFGEMRRRNPALADFRLVIAGFVDVKSRPYVVELKKLAAGQPVDFIADPSDEKLEELYRDCRAVLFTALNEDWGIVPLEGMSFGKPVISVNRGGPKESVDHGESGFLEAPEPQAFAARMAELAGSTEIAVSMGATARERVKRFNWPRFASRVDDELELARGQAAEVRGVRPLKAHTANR